MNLTDYYEGSRLLSITYCERKIKELEEELYDTGYKGFTPDDERVKSLNERISYYRNMISRLRISLGKLNSDKLSKLITEEISKKLADYRKDSLLVLFSHIDAHVFEIMVGNLFVTDFFSKEQLYERSKLLDKHYDNSVYLSRIHLTNHGASIVSKIEKTLIAKFPKIKFQFRHI